jgi:hypothetical protein
MFSLSKRQGRTALAAAAGAATYLATSEIGARKLRVSGLFLLSSAALAGLVASRSSAKSIAVENRLNNLINNGGSFGGDIHVVGNHYVTGTQAVSSNQTVGGTQAVSSNQTVGGSQTVNGNGNFGGALSASGTSGDAQQGNFDDSDGDAHQGACSATYVQAELQAAINRINHLIDDHNALNTDAQAIKNRVNDFIAALG